MFTLFMDMHSGGGRKASHDFIIIEADTEALAVEQFTQHFGHDPYDIACMCCGENYSVTSEETLADVVHKYVTDPLVIYANPSTEPKVPMYCRLLS
jgi:hypothetical protein